MTTEIEHRKKVIALAIFLFMLWVFLWFLPLIALRSPWFVLGSQKDVETVRSVLAQLGTYGDMFGALNSFFSGAAFVGVVLAVLYQKRQIDLQHKQIEIQKQEIQMQTQEIKAAEREKNEMLRHQRRTILIEATSQLANVYATIYVAARELYDNHYYASIIKNQSDESDQSYEDTFYHKMIKYRGYLEGLLKEIESEPDHRGNR